MLVFAIASRGETGSHTAIASQTLLLAVIFGIGGLSLLEHVKSPRTSDSINVYLFFSTILDGVQLRTVWLRHCPLSVSIAASICFALKLVLLIAEAQSKFSWLMEDFHSLAPESLSGVYARRVFWWLNGLMGRGYRTTFRPVDLMPIKEDFASQGLLDAFKATSSKSDVFRSSLQAFRWDVGFLTIPRLVTLALSYTQPFLFQAIIGHLDIPYEKRDVNNGYGLIAATGLLYLLLAISKTYYQHKTYQLVTKVRGALVSMLYACTLDSAPASLTDRAPVTLMSVDVDGITNVVPMYNETWACAVEVGIAVYLLKRQLGIVWVVPFGVAFCKSSIYDEAGRKLKVGLAQAVPVSLFICLAKWAHDKPNGIQ